MNQHLIRSILSVAAAALVAVGAVASPAAADPPGTADPAAPPVITDPVPGGFPTWQDVFAVQGRMNAALEDIRQVERRLPDSGFGSAVAAPENRRLEIYWHGALPEPVRTAIVRAGARIPIVVRPARYTERELLLASERLGQHRELAEISPLSDAGGLLVRRAAGADHRRGGADRPG